MDKIEATSEFASTVDISQLSLHNTGSRDFVAVTYPVHEFSGPHSQKRR
jgi:hypothetical protein